MTAKPRIRVDQKGSVTAVNGMMIDGMMNVITGLGMSNAKTSATHYVPVDNVLERDNAYRASTWYRKIVTIPAADAVREWRAWQAAKDQIEKIEGEEKRLAVRNVVYQALLTARHTGGAVILIGGLPGSMLQPLRLDSIRAGSIKYLTVLGRDEITAGQIIRDPQSDWFGLPERWTLNDQRGGALDIHPSRVVFVNGRTVPGTLRRTGEVWGDSVWVQMTDSIRAADNVAGVIDALLHEAKIDVVRIKNMVSQMATGTAEQDYIRRWTMVAALKSISNVLMLDGDDEWDQKTMTWGGLPDIARTLLTIMAGAADIPVTRLTGEQQTGLSGADSGSLRNYYDSIRAVQELEYTPALAPLDEMLIRSALGERDPSIWYQWRSLYQPAAKELAEVDKLQAESVKIYADSGLVPQDAMAEMVQNRLVESASWPGADTAYEASKMELELPAVEEDESEDPSAITADAAPRTLYVRRDVLNAAEIIAHFKAQGLAFVTGQAFKVNSQVYETRYPDWDFGRLIYVDSSGPEWAPGVLTYTSDMSGRANWQSGYAKDVPMADVSQDYQTKTFHLAAIGYQWNIEEVNTTMGFPGANLPDRRARAARLAYMKFMYDLTLKGATEKGLGGLINYAGVTTINAPNDGTGSSRYWVDSAGVGQKTPAQIVRDINIALQGVWLDSKEIEMADTILLPIEAYNYIAASFSLRRLLPAMRLRT